MFSNVVESFNNILIGENAKEGIILEEDEKLIDMSKNVIIIVDPFNMDFNSRQILNRLFEDIIKTYTLEDELRMEMQEFYQHITSNIYNITADYPFEIIIKDECKLQDILKNVSLKIDSKYYSSLAEKIMGIIDISSSLNLFKLLIFVNLKTYVDNEKLEEIYKYSLYKNQKILIVENKECSFKSVYEKKLCIDEDFYEIIE